MQNNLTFTTMQNSSDHIKAISTLDLTNMDLQSRIMILSLYFRLCDCIDALGFHEHSGDWDPYFIVTLNNDTVVETESGYWDADLDLDTWSVKFHTNINNNETCIVVPIMDIHSIKIQGY